MSQPVSCPSEFASEGQVHGCRWAWCRYTFTSNVELVHHVIHDHVSLAVPVRRRDIPLLRRTEEGVGDSLTISEMNGIYSNAESAEIIRQKKEDSISKQREGPSSSLPSPPASSPASIALEYIPEQHAIPPTGLHDLPFIVVDTSKALVNNKFVTQSLPAINDRESNPISSNIQNGNCSQYSAPTTPESGRRILQTNITPTFESLSSPHMDFLPTIPESPSFDSIVKRATQRTSHQLQRSNDVPYTEGLTSSHSSFDSRELVEMQLTQGSDVDDSPSNGKMTTSIRMQDDTVDFDWRPFVELSPGDDRQSVHPASPSSIPQALQFPLQSLSLPLSQFQRDTPTKPLGSSTPLRSQTELQLSPISIQSPSAPLNSPTFAVSTPILRQAWYQPPVPRRKSRRKSDRLPDDSQQASQGSSPRRGFRSGTLQILPGSSPVAASSPQVAIVDSSLLTHQQPGTQAQDDWSNSHTESQSYSQETFHSYPLQTQAPYQSQSQGET